MPFKFTLLGIEFSKSERNISPRERNNLDYKMKSKKQSKHQKAFGRAVKTCHRKTLSPKAFGKCMRKELK